jgi:putative PIN family toxin of toxin-antitoxin system
MIRVLFDNNIWISFLIGKQLNTLLDVFGRPDVVVCYCDELEQEFLNVAHRPKILRYVNEEQIERVHQLMTQFCELFEVGDTASITNRDPKDIYLLALAESVPVDYIVSGDKDLTDLHQHAGIPILKYVELLEILNV